MTGLLGKLACRRYLRRLIVVLRGAASCIFHHVNILAKARGICPQWRAYLVHIHTELACGAHPVYKGGLDETTDTVSDGH
jgi:hypothetical protein